MNFKKAFVLFVLFVLPLVAYLFFASGIHNFGKLPVLTEQVQELGQGEVRLQDKITVLGFLGSQVDQTKGIVLNLNQKIYKPFHEFTDFQFVMVVPQGQEAAVESLKKEMGQLGDIDKWYFVFLSEEEIGETFQSLGSNISLDAHWGSPYVFLVDKDRNLRGRTDDEDEGVKYGFDARSVAEINNKMEDDVKILLAEYRMALKKNNVAR